MSVDIDFPTVIDVALLIVRIGLGVTLAAHGYNKFYGGGRIPGTAGWFASIGMKPGMFHANLAATGEVVAGVFFAIGLFTSFAAAGFVALMVIAALLVHRKEGFFIVSGGWEYTFILGLVPLTVAMIGPGELSVDHVIELSGTRISFLFDEWLGLIIAGAGVPVSLLFLATFYRKPPEG